MGTLMECGLSLIPLSPDGLVLCHLPHGPTAHFTLSGAVLRHEVGGLGGAPLGAPHILLHRLDSALGRRVRGRRGIAGHKGGREGTWVCGDVGCGVDGGTGEVMGTGTLGLRRTRRYGVSRGHRGMWGCGGIHGVGDVGMLGDI